MATNSMDCIDDGSQYVISINVQEWSELEEHAETEHFLDVNNIVQVRSRKLKCTWIKAFEKKINDYENEEFKLLGMKIQLNKIYYDSIVIFRQNWQNK
jgi:hypothetical protein